MLFIIQWTMPPESRDAALARFKETGGPAPAGVKMIGRWHAVDMSWGLALAEGNDGLGMAKWSHDWSDLLILEVTPVIDDAGFAKVIGG